MNTPHYMHYMYSFIVYGHMGCFHLGNIMNNAAMNIQQVSCGHMFSFPLVYIQEWNLLSSKMKNNNNKTTHKNPQVEIRIAWSRFIKCHLQLW